MQDEGRQFNLLADVQKYDCRKSPLKGIFCFLLEGNVLVAGYALDNDVVDFIGVQCSFLMVMNRIE